jgi:hypothetical protein
MPTDALLVAALFSMAAAPFLFDLWWSRRIASVAKQDRAGLRQDLSKLDRTWRAKIVWISLSMPRPLPERARANVRKGPKWSKNQTAQLAEDFTSTAGRTQTQRMILAAFCGLMIVLGSRNQTAPPLVVAMAPAFLWLLIGSLWAWGEGYSRWASEVFTRAAKTGATK